jgi:hypothetical protein
MQTPVCIRMTQPLTAVPCCASSGRPIHGWPRDSGSPSKSGNPEVAEATNTEVLDFGNRALQHEHPCASSGLPRCGAMGNVNVSRALTPQVRVHGWQPFDNLESRSLSSLIVLALFYNPTDIPKLYCRTYIVSKAVLAWIGSGVVSCSHRETGWGRGLVRTCRAGETAPRILRVRDEEKYGLELAVVAERRDAAATGSPEIPRARRDRTGDRTALRSACDEVLTCSGLFQPVRWYRTASGPHIPAS